MGRIALLGIAHRKVCIPRTRISRNLIPRKRLPALVKTLGDRIKTRRFELGLLESQVAHSLNVSVVTLRAWENDLKLPKM
jgi:DNA-binding transcriptional regulator YiaG